MADELFIIFEEFVGREFFDDLLTARIKTKTIDVSKYFISEINCVNGFDMKRRLPLESFFDM